MNNLKKSVFFIVFGLFIVLFFSACENFLDGSDLKDKLEKAVSIANAPEVSVRVLSEKGDISPNGDIKVKVGQESSIISSPYTSYEFVKWQVCNRSTNKIYSDEEAATIVEFGNSRNKDSTFTLKQNLKDIMIQPLLAVRPQVISNTPLYSSSGVYRDSRIQVMFDKPMNPNSIYYTSEELTNLGITDVEKLLTGGDSKPSSIETVSTENKVYGYKDGSGQIFYKNIYVTNRFGKNILECFGEPSFETEDSLVIPVNKDKANFPPPSNGTQIIVTITQGFTYLYESKDIAMTEDKKWTYLVNGGTDRLLQLI